MLNKELLKDFINCYEKNKSSDALLEKIFCLYFPELDENDYVQCIEFYNWNEENFDNSYEKFISDVASKYKDWGN